MTMTNHQNPLLIGLAGPAHSGKDTLARYLVCRYGFTRMAFADLLKRMLLALELGPEYTDGPGKEAIIPWLGCSYRRLCQTLGTEWGRDSICSDLWVKLLDRQIDRLEHSNAMAVDRRHPYHMRIVISDVRFPNEAEYIRDRGYLWHIRRPGHPGLQGWAREHPSERPITPRPDDLQLVNRENELTALFARIDEAMSRHL